MRHAAKRCFPATALALWSLVAVSPWASAADWLQFRGNDGRPISTDQLPESWNEGQNVAWKSDLPGRGVSGPIVVDGRVITTSASGPRQDRLHVLAIDAQTGQKRWERQFWATGRTLCHPTSSVAAPTPASDGQRIFAFFSSNDLACLDLDGNLLWYRGLGFDYPDAGNDVGMSSSPVVLGDTVVLQVESQGDSFAIGLDAATGENRWRVDRLRKSNWTSPTVYRGKAPHGDLVLLQSTGGLAAHDPQSGKLIWNHEGECSGIPSTSVVDDVIYVPGNVLTAMKRDPTSQASEILWENNKLSASSASPVVFDNKVLALNRAGVLTCAQAADGEQLWQLRLKGPIWATPVIAGDLLYTFNQDGLGQVVRLADKGQLVSENPLEQPVFGTPAIADGGLFVRTDSQLWKIAKP